MRHLISDSWFRGVEIFKFLPIRFKLSLIIGSIVIVVVTAFSVIILHNQRAALMKRMTEVCNMLIQNLSDNVKDGLLLGENVRVSESALRLRNSKIEGLEQIAVINHRGEIVAAFTKAGDRFQFDQQETALQVRRFTVKETDDQFQYFYPITTLHQERNILLGVAYVSFSKRAILEPIRHATKIALGSACMVIIFSIVGIYLIAKKMASQIKQLSDGARQIGHGNLDVRISVNSKDELGMLAEEFNNMAQHLREKLHMQKFVSKLTVDMIKDSVRTEGNTTKAVNQNVTVLFSDVRNFSTIAEELEPEEIVKLINIYFDLQTKIIERHHGIVDKFMGDQIMAVFRGKDMADNTLRSAVEIQRQIKLLNQERASKRQVTLEMGIGINNGTAVMGNMGSTNRMDHTVIGDVVNVAARLCSIAKAGQIITSFELAKKVNGSYPTTRLKSISVKGRSKLIDVCEVDYNKEIIM